MVVESSAQAVFSHFPPLDAEAVACLRDQALSEFGIYTSVACLVGIGQRRAFDIVSEAHGVELGNLYQVTGFDIA